MAIMRIYAGPSASSLTELPSPVDLKRSDEEIWSENTGRAQTGTNKAKMIGDVVASKRKYQIKWGILTGTELTSIKNHLTTGFFYFAAATSAASAQTNAASYYRGELQYDIIQAGPDVYYKDVAVSVIEQ